MGTTVPSFSNASTWLRAITLEWIDGCLLGGAALSARAFGCICAAVLCTARYFGRLVLPLLRLIMCFQQGSGGAGRSWRSCREPTMSSCPGDRRRRVLASQMGNTFQSSRAGRGLSGAPWTGMERPKARKVGVMDARLQDVRADVPERVV